LQLAAIKMIVGHENAKGFGGNVACFEVDSVQHLYFVRFTFSSVLGNIRAGYSIIPVGVDIITYGDFNVSFGFDIITATFNQTVFGFYKLLFGGHKATIGSINSIGRHNNIGQTPFRRPVLLFIWK
jgi:hypothetical protein